MKKSFYKILLVVGLIVIGILIGLVIGNVPYVSFKPEVGFGDIGNFVLAFFVALAIPMILNEQFDSQKNIKAFLTDEIKDCLDSLREIKDKIEGCGIISNTTKEDAVEIRFLIITLEMRIDSLNSQLVTLFKKRGQKIAIKLEGAYIKYWRDLTDESLYSDQFKVDNDFCRLSQKTFQEMDKSLKMTIYEINEL